MKKVNIHNLHETQWKTYFEFFQRTTSRYMPRDWVEDWESFRQRRIANLTVLPSREVVFFEGENIVAWIRVEEVTGRAYFDWNTHVSPLPETLMLGLKTVMREFLVERNLPSISIETGNPSMAELAPYLNARMINQRYFFEFHHQEANFPLIEQRLKTFEQNHPSIRFQLYKDRPDEILDEYIELYNLVSLAIPRKDATGEPYRSWPAEKLRKLNESNRKTGNTTYTGVLRNDSGKMIGLTDLNINTRQTERMYQGMTGIHPDYRKKGFGEWLKIAMLLRVKADFPGFKIIDTDSNALNIPMHKLNLKIGYKKTSEGGEYEIMRENLS
ncbi:MAG: GNAT family N-acetyltransferase [Bacteroidetes bacterium]|nr:GNAT family N-acetyltransferase [Bacteroidota bacterium]